MLQQDLVYQNLCYRNYPLPRRVQNGHVRTIDDIPGNGISVVCFHRDFDVLCAIEKPRIVGVRFVEYSATKVRVLDNLCCQVLSQRANGGHSYYDYQSNHRSLDCKN